MYAFLQLRANKQWLNKLEKHRMGRFEMAEMGDVSRVLELNMARDHKNGTITIHKKVYTEGIVERFGMKGWNPTFALGATPDRSLKQAEKRLPYEEGKQR